MTSYAKTERTTRILITVFLACVFILGIIKIESYDAGTHLSLGREIVNNRGFPDNEPFSYPSLNRGFADPEWLFDVVFYLAYAAFSLYGVILLKAAIVTGAIYILLKDSLIPDREHIASIAVLIFIVFMIRHRIVERPDIALMFFLAFLIYSLNAFVHEGKKYIYILPLTQIIWVNMHPSTVLVIVPFSAFIIGGILHRILNRRYKLKLPFTPTNRQLAVIMLVFMAVLVATLLNPYTSYSFSAPTEMMSGTSWYADEITELQKPLWKDFKMVYFLTAAIILSFFVNIKRISIIHVFLVAPFIYMAFSGLRFMFLLGIVGAPVIVRNIAAQIKINGKAWRILNASLITVLIIITTLACLEIKPFTTPGKKFGFGYNNEYLPELALQYLDKRNIYGRIFNAFHWGGYITWRDFPKRSAFVDGRGNISRELLESLDVARTRPKLLEELHEKYGFNVALLSYVLLEKFFREVDIDIDFGLSSKDWALVYWDDLSMVYLKRGDEFKHIIEQDEYRYVVPANGASAVRSRLHDKNYLEGLISELKRNINETGSSMAYTFLGFIYNDKGMYKEAIEALSKVEDYPIMSNIYNAYQGLAFAYSKTGEYEKSIKYYKKAFKLKNDAVILHNIGLAYMEMNDNKTCIRYLEKALKMNNRIVSIYPILMSLYQENDDQIKYNEALLMYEQAKKNNMGEEHFQKGLAAYIAKKHNLALEELKRSIEVNRFNPAAYNNIGYIYYDLGLFDRSHMYQKQALDLDPNYANAHYGIALVFLKWNDRGNAIYHFQEYLRIEPKGYFSRKAKKEIFKLQSVTTN